MPKRINVVIVEDQRSEMQKIVGIVRNVAHNLNIVSYQEHYAHQATATYQLFPEWLNHKGVYDEPLSDLLYNQTEIEKIIADLTNLKVPDEERRVLLIFDIYVAPASISNLQGYIRAIASRTDPLMSEQPIIVFAAIEKKPIRLERKRDHFYVVGKAQGARLDEEPEESLSKAIEKSLLHLLR